MKFVTSRNTGMQPDGLEKPCAGDFRRELGIMESIGYQGVELMVRNTPGAHGRFTQSRAQSPPPGSAFRPTIPMICPQDKLGACAQGRPPPGQGNFPAHDGRPLICRASCGRILRNGQVPGASSDRPGAIPAKKPRKNCRDFSGYADQRGVVESPRSAGRRILELYRPGSLKLLHC